MVAGRNDGSFRVFGDSNLGVSLVTRGVKAKHAGPIPKRQITMLISSLLTATMKII
uniref:hypothetical protein n=1 Tax=Salmonella sp. TaxID=599 RepID=UPI0021E64FBC|nr:hypothetical protein [Salmonella sp.]